MEASSSYSLWIASVCCLSSLVGCKLDVKEMRTTWLNTQIYGITQWQFKHIRPQSAENWASRPLCHT
jgi:hypothetical protein